MDLFWIDMNSDAMNPKRGDLVHLKDIISAIFSDSKLPFNPDDARIWQEWDDVVGDPICRHARPAWVKEGRLRVKVTDPIWLQELDFLGENIKDRLNKRLGREAVKKIEFRVGPVKT
jgi:hypothetical protein